MTSNGFRFLFALDEIRDSADAIEKVFDFVCMRKHVDKDDDEAIRRKCVAIRALADGVKELHFAILRDEREDVRETMEMESDEQTETREDAEE